MVSTYLSLGRYRIFTGPMPKRGRILGGGSPTEGYKYLWWRIFRVADLPPYRWSLTLKKDCAEFAHCPSCGFYFWPQGEDLMKHYAHRRLTVWQRVKRWLN
jgi:hypothetical protein